MFTRQQRIFVGNLMKKGACRRQCTWQEPGGFETGLKVYNSVKKCNVPLKLKSERMATWYMCGPTVYDSAHIGHACTYVRLDIIRRILDRFFDIGATTIMGITDIDDKIIKRSANLGVDWKSLTKQYEQEFCSEMNLLNVAPPYLYCRVTDYVPQIIQFIQKIMSTDAAYVASDGSVYFDTTKYGKYGKLSKMQQCSEARGIKKDASDFALWKASKPGEPFWESPWGNGRPGWHIECSAIASATLGKTIDIHSGGIDLLFPHHENEEAQSCSYHEIDQWVNYWLHTGHLYLSGEEKMSKSLNNTISIKKFLETYSADEFRLFCLLTHYRTGIEFSEAKMQSATAILRKFEHFLSDCRNHVAGKLNKGIIDETLALQTLKVTKENVKSALASDFDTRKAVLAIQDLVAVVNKMLNTPEDGKNLYSSTSSASVAIIADYVRSTLCDFGFSDGTKSDVNTNNVAEIIETFVEFRKTVRNRALEQNPKDKRLLEACDEARKNLAFCNVIVKDHKDTSTWTLSRDSKVQR